MTRNLFRDLATLVLRRRGREEARMKSQTFQHSQLPCHTRPPEYIWENGTTAVYHRHRHPWMEPRSSPADREEEISLANRLAEATGAVWSPRKKAKERFDYHRFDVDTTTSRILRVVLMIAMMALFCAATRSLAVWIARTENALPQRSEIVPSTAR
jgi:hypothetical protein